MYSGIFKVKTGEILSDGNNHLLAEITVLYCKYTTPCSKIHGYMKQKIINTHRAVRKGGQWCLSTSIFGPLHAHYLMSKVLVDIRW